MDNLFSGFFLSVKLQMQTLQLKVGNYNFHIQNSCHICVVLDLTLRQSLFL